ncbi:MAG: indole-3-glycerol phosphate synthase TrpC [Actinobacteria bacterium]|nr:indole-3-glycerol phosphate synthase TrpC [Actinomycetota bacterium]
MTTYLDGLLDGARARVAAARAALPLDELRERASAVSPPPSLLEALGRTGVQVIAELKRASPSRGDLAPSVDAAGQARAYLAGGAAAVSVLTEPDRFKGSLDDLHDVATLGAPTLRKDFLVDPYQVWEAKRAGASAVLLIVAALDDDLLEVLLREARDAGLDALVEVHDAPEGARAVAAGAAIIGVNARDLRTFELDDDAFARIRPQLPDSVVTVAESGISGPDDVARAGRVGADAVLVGEAVVTADDPTTAVAALVAAGQRTTTG